MWLLKLILSTIIIFFVWNILKRLFFNSFYNKYPHQKKWNEASQTQKKNNPKSENLNWDAETVDYEEIKEGK